MEDTVCPACKAENEDDAAFCDQCGQPLTETPAAAEGAEGDCPACGGVVESRGDGKGVCAGCGLELVETPEEPPAVKAEEGTVERLTAAILNRTIAGMPLERAVAEACSQIFQAPEAEKKADAAPKNEIKPETCPLCGAENPGGAVKCAGCGIIFRETRSAQACPRCEREVRGGKCECGAILTLRKLLEYVEPSVRFVCGRCKQPYAVFQPKCPDCGGGLLSADRLKAYAKSAVS